MNLNRAKKTWTGDDEEPDYYPYAVATERRLDGSVVVKDSVGRFWISLDGTCLNWERFAETTSLARQAIRLFPHSKQIPRTQTNYLRRQWIAARLYLGDRALVLRRVERKN